MMEGRVECWPKIGNTLRGWIRAQARRLPFGDVGTFPKRMRETTTERPAFVDRLLLSIEDLTTQIDLADEEPAVRAKADAACNRLMSVPGVGPVT